MRLVREDIYVIGVERQGWLACQSIPARAGIPGQSGDRMGESHWHLYIKYCALYTDSGWACSICSPQNSRGAITNHTALQVDTLTVSFAVHYLNGIASPANAAYSAAELAYQLKSAGSKAIFVSYPSPTWSLGLTQDSDVHPSPRKCSAGSKNCWNPRETCLHTRYGRCVHRWQEGTI